MWSLLAHYHVYFLHIGAGGGVRERVEMVGNMADEVFHLGQVLQGLQSQQRSSNGIWGTSQQQMGEFQD